MTMWRVLGRCGVGLLLILGGCATQVPPVPVPQIWQAGAMGWPRQVLVTQGCAGSLPVSAPWQVVVQQEGQALRWSRFNLLGVPDARQILENRTWRNDGFIAPNAQAREMFAALLFAWLSQAELDASYGVRRWRALWPDNKPGDAFTIVREADGVCWDVQPLSEMP